MLAIGLVGATSHSVRAQGIPEETLNKLKAATVFLKVDTPEGMQTGSGFVLRASSDSGLIVTNSHVICDEEGVPGRVSAVFHSGSRNEVSVAASVVAADPSRDLALLSVRHSELPESLDTQTPVEVRETLPIFAVGFPFGEALSTSKRNPAVTISKGAISAVRRDDYDNVSVLQIDGGLNPGNSGGPVVTEAGVLVGIAVAKVEGSEIGFAIPKEQLADMLRGRVLAVQTSPLDNPATRWHFHVQFIDPDRKIREVSVLTAEKRLAAQARPLDNGRWGPAATPMQSHPLAVQDGAAQGRVDVRRHAAEPLVFQIRCVRENGDVTHTQPAELTVASTNEIATTRVPDGPTEPSPVGPDANDSDDSPSQSGSFDMEPLTAITFDESFSNVVAAGGGKYLVVHFARKGEAAVVDLESRETIGTIPAAEDALIAGSMDKIVVVSPFDNVCNRWSLPKLKKEKSGALPISGQAKAISMGCGSKGPLLVFWATGAGALDPAVFSLVDINTLRGQLISSARGSSSRGGLTQRSVRDDVQLRASGNGTTFGVWQLHVSPTGLEVVTLFGRPSAVYEHTSVGHVAPTADGMAVCTAQGFMSADLARKRDVGMCFPALNGNMFLVVAPEGLEVRDVKNAEVLVTWPVLPEFRDSSRGRAVRIGIDQRFLLNPQLRLLATIPITDDRIVLRKFQLSDDAPDDAPIASRPATTPQPPASSPAPAEGEPAVSRPSGSSNKREPVRQWTDRTGKFRVLAKMVEATESSVTLESADGKKIMVPLDRLSDSDAEYVRRAAAEK